MPTSQICTVAVPSQLTLLLGCEITAVTSLAEARTKVKAFIREHDLCAGDYGALTGRIERDGKPYARVSYHGRLWALDEAGRETYREMNDAGEVAP